VRWRFLVFEFEPYTRLVFGAPKERLGQRDAKVLDFLLKKRFKNEPYTNEDIINYAWGPRGSLDDLHHSVTRLRAIFETDDNCEPFIVAGPFTLVPKAEYIDEKVPVSRQIGDGTDQGKTSVQFDSRRLPSALEARIDALRLAPPIADAVRRVLGAEKFPTIMTLSEDTVLNPIWERIPPDDRQRLVAEFSPFGSMLRRFMDIDVCLIRADDANGNPYLLHYFSGKPKSGWQAYLFPFRYKSPGESESVRQAENARIIAGYFLMSSSDFSTQSLGDQFVVSVKPDVGYSSELVTYIFNFCVVTMRIAPKWLSCLEPQLKNGQSVQKFRWFHAGELELEDRSVLVNADVLRGIHHFFGTSIPSVPVGFPGILETEC
jgi:hypothetical protein